MGQDKTQRKQASNSCPQNQDEGELVLIELIEIGRRLKSAEEYERSQEEIYQIKLQMQDLDSRVRTLEVVPDQVEKIIKQNNDLFELIKKEVIEPKKAIKNLYIKVSLGILTAIVLIAIFGPEVVKAFLGISSKVPG